MLSKFMRGSYHITLFKGHQLRIFWQLRHGAKYGPRTIRVYLAMMKWAWSSSASMKFHKDGSIPVAGHIPTYSIYTIFDYEKVLQAPYHVTLISKPRVTINHEDYTVVKHEGNA